jgi:hypothetical protein
MSLRGRELLWLSCLDHDGTVRCNLCGGPVRCGEDWHVSHVGAPKCLGGTSTGVAHAKCNRDHNHQVVTPMVAKAKRQWRRHNGISGPGLGSRPMAGGKRSDISKGFRGVVARQTQADKHRRAMARRYHGDENEAD